MKELVLIKLQLTPSVILLQSLCKTDKRLRREKKVDLGLKKVKCSKFSMECDRIVFLGSLWSPKLHFTTLCQRDTDHYNQYLSFRDRALQRLQESHPELSLSTAESRTGNYYPLLSPNILYFHTFMPALLQLP